MFRHEVFKMLKTEGKINDVVIENMMNWPPARRAYGSESLRLGENHSIFYGHFLVKPYGMME